jgi:nucleoside-diphosphate-sugar epimerase
MNTKFKMDNSKLSIYGGSGFIGGRFLELNKHRCILINREKRKPETNEIIYFISTTHNYHVFDNLQKDIDTNLSVLMEVLDSVKENKNTVINFISSWFVYGETHLPAHEDVCCKPKGFYSITKHAAENLLISFCHTYGIKYRILRLSNVYGNNDRGVSKKKNALQYLISEMKKNNQIDLYHGGNFYRDYLHVDDICRAIDLCISKAPLNEIINIGSGKKVKFKEIINIAKKELKSSSKIAKIDPPEFHKIIQVKDFYMDVEKIKKIGFFPKIDIYKGIKELCQN